MITHHLILLVCLFTSYPGIFHISLLSSPERPANSARFSVGIKNGVTAIILSRYSKATNSRKKEPFHYPVAGAGSGRCLAFIWRAPNYATFPLDSKTQVSLQLINSTYWATFWKLISWIPKWYRKMEACEDMIQDRPRHPRWKIWTLEEFPILNNVQFKIYSLETLLNVQAHGCYL